MGFGLGNFTGRRGLTLVGVTGKQPGNIDLQNAASSSATSRRGIVLPLTYWLI